MGKCRVGRQMRCSNCHTIRHNKASYDKEHVPKPLKERKLLGRKRHGGDRGGSWSGKGCSNSGNMYAYISFELITCMLEIRVCLH